MKIQYTISVPKITLANFLSELKALDLKPKVKITKGPITVVSCIINTSSGAWEYTTEGESDNEAFKILLSEIRKEKQLGLI